MSLLLRSFRLAVLALAATAGAHAAELGEASVRSFSGQPLSADIELTDLTTQELADLQVRLARPNVFQGANVKMNPALAGAQIAIARRDSRRVLQVTTSAPVQGEVLHLYFQLVSGGKERVRGVTLWLSPAPAPAPAPAALASAPAAPAVPTAAMAAAERSAKAPARLVAVVSPGKEATPGERELLGAVERAFASRGGKVEPAAPARPRSSPGSSPKDSERDIRKEALKYASTADDFKRRAKPAKPVAEKEPEATHEVAAQAEPEKKAPQRSFLPSKAELAEAARATRASVEGGAPPVAKAVEAAPQAGTAKPAGGAADPAMLNKLAELEGKLKTLQAQLAMTNTAGAARVSLPMPGKTDAAPVAAPPASPATAAPPKTPDTVTMAAAAASQPEPAGKPVTGPAVAESPALEAAPHAPASGEPPAVPDEEPKAKPEPKKEAAPPPPEPKKEIKISRPKLLTFLFAGSLVLLAIFGVIVHFVRKAKLKRSPIVRQSWSREEDDVAARVEPAIAPPAQPAEPAQPESKAA